MEYLQYGLNISENVCLCVWVCEWVYGLRGADLYHVLSVILSISIYVCIFECTVYSSIG